MKTLGTIIGYCVALTVLFAIVWIFLKVLGAVFWLLVPVFTMTGVTLLLIVLGLLLAFMCGTIWGDK